MVLDLDLEFKDIKVLKKYLFDQENKVKINLDQKMYYIQSWLMNQVDEQEEDIINIKIDRKDAVSNFIYQFNNINVDHMIRKQLVIRFKGEEGQDQGGLTQEIYSILQKEIINLDNGFWKITENKYYILPNELALIQPNYFTIYFFIGKLMAKALLDGLFIEINFSKIIFKQLLNIPLELQDISDIDQQLYNSLLNIKNNSVEGLYLTFEYQYQVLDKIISVDLMDYQQKDKNFEYTNVDDTNKEFYIEKLIKFKYYQQIKHVDILFQGFREVIPQQILEILSLDQLFSYFIGQDICIEDMKRNTNYEGYNKQSNQIKWFWQIFEELGQKNQLLFLEFLTGLTKVPFGGFIHIQITITKVLNLNSLPVAHTCFNSLDLPNYQSYEIMKEKIIKAITLGNEGFFIL